MRRWPFAKRRAPPPPSTGGRLVYAIGDVHGRLDLMLALLGRIRVDAQTAPPASPPLVIFLGDYVDRGPASRQVITALIALRAAVDIEIVTLKGNHEAALLHFLDDAGFGSTWAGFGCGETLASYGVEAPPRSASDEAWERTRDQFAERLPDSHLAFLQSLPTLHVVGDFAFVHAGVRPGTALDVQDEEDLLWIREPFLSVQKSCGKVIVHGHTPTETPYDGRFRIGVDTGAYATSVLTGVRLEGATRAFIQVSPTLTTPTDRDPPLNLPALGPDS